MPSSPMFTIDSFKDIPDQEHAAYAVQYLAHNQRAFESELIESGPSYEDVQRIVADTF